jgi:hypothetical protein
MRVKLQKVFQTLHVLTREKYYKTLYFPLSLTSENKNKKQKDIIAESKGNNFEHSHTRMRVPFTLPPQQRRQKRA